MQTLREGILCVPELLAAAELLWRLLPADTPEAIPSGGSEAISADGEGSRSPPAGRTAAQDEKKKKNRG